MTEFDEIAVGVAQVDALHRTAAAVTRDGAELDARTFCQELLLHLLDILVHDKAEVQAAALRMARRRQELRRSLVDIDLRRAKEQRISPLPLLHPHVEQIAVEVQASRQISRRQHNMIECCNSHTIVSSQKSLHTCLCHFTQSTGKAQSKRAMAMPRPLKKL